MIIFGNMNEAQNMNISKLEAAPNGCHLFVVKPTTSGLFLALEYVTHKGVNYSMNSEPSTTRDGADEILDTYRNEFWRGIL